MRAPKDHPRFLKPAIGSVDMVSTRLDICKQQEQQVPHFSVPVPALLLERQPLVGQSESLRIFELSQWPHCHLQSGMRPSMSSRDFHKLSWKCGWFGQLLWTPDLCVIYFPRIERSAIVSSRCHLCHLKVLFMFRHQPRLGSKDRAVWERKHQKQHHEGHTPSWRLSEDKNSTNEKQMTGAVSRQSLFGSIAVTTQLNSRFLQRRLFVDQGVVIVVVFSHVQTGYLHGFMGIDEKFNGRYLWRHLCQMYYQRSRNFSLSHLDHRVFRSGRVGNWQTWYCWWKKSCTTLDVWNPVNNGIFTISTGAGFFPSTVWGK